MKGKLRGVCSRTIVSTFIMVFSVILGSFPAMAQVKPPTPQAPTRTTPNSSNIVGTITAIGADSFTLQPKATDASANPSPITVTVDSTTKIVMRGDSDAAVSNLAAGYSVMVLQHAAIPAAGDMPGIPAFTIVLVSPKDLPVDLLQNDQVP